MSTRILSAFNPLKRVGFAVLLYAHCAFAQPYEPTYLLDVTGEVNQAIGRFNLQALSDQNADGFDDFLTSVVDANENSSLRIYWGNNLSTSDFLDFGRFDSTGREIGWQDASFDAGFTVPAGDVNGDGYADIMRTLCVWYDAQCHLYPCLFLGGPGVFDTLADWVGDLTTMRFTTNVGDYNGDGRDDYTSRPLSAQYFGLYFGQEPPLSQEYEWEHTPNRNHMGFGDVNGDGFSDFGMSYFMGSVGIARTEIFLGSTEADSVADVVIERSTGDNERNGRIVGDLNGDGFDDVLTHFSSWSEGQRWLLYYGGIEMDTEIDDELVWGDGIGAPEYVTPLGDINADAFDDYAFYENNEGLDINHIEVWLGGNPLPTAPAWILDGPLDGMNYPYRIGEAGDFNGDGIDDWFFSAYHGLEERGRIIVIAGDRNFGVAADELPATIPAAFVLHACYPNPFNSSVTIPLEVTGTGTQHVTLTIANTLGQIAYSFPQTNFTPGLHTLRWNGSDAATGLYFVIAHSHNARHIQKILLIK